MDGVAIYVVVVYVLISCLLCSSHSSPHMSKSGKERKYEGWNISRLHQERYDK